MPTQLLVKTQERRNRMVKKKPEKRSRPQPMEIVDLVLRTAALILDLLDHLH